MNFSKKSVPFLTTAAIAATLCPGYDAYAQSVSDRVLSDVKVQSVGTCSTMTINFNVRVQLQSFFPQTGGRELHIRIKPLDDAAKVRESLRTPTGVPALRSIEYEGDNVAGPILSLFFSRDVRFDVSAGAQPQQIIITVDEPGTTGRCEATATAGAAAPSASPPPTAPDTMGALPVARPAMAVPSGLYVVNVISQPAAIGDLSAAKADALSDMVVYETRFERDAQTWHRLRAGFFETREQAQAAAARLAKLFPEAWVTKVSAQEREQGVTTRLAAGNDATPVASLVKPAAPLSDADRAAAASVQAEAETAIKGGENDRAIQLLTKALGFPENEGTPRVLELLGLTRERKGQLAHAQAEYEEYLRRYPSGEGADRVRQRLAGVLAPAAAQEAPALRAASGSAGKAGGGRPWKWGARGSFSQFYFRDQSTNKFNDATRIDPTTEVDNSVNLNQLLTNGDVTISGGDDRNAFQFRAAGSYSKDFRPAGRDVKSLTALYLDFVNNQLDLSARIGRQTRNSAGVFGRFDGAMFGWQAKRKIRINTVAGFPVENSRQTKVKTDRAFYGVSVDFGAKRDSFQTSLYWFDQRTHGLIDRQAIGAEARYFKNRFNAYGLIDYDVKFKEVTLGLVSFNYSLPDTSSFSLTADYRRSPPPTVTRALDQQNVPGIPITLDQIPIKSLAELRTFYSMPQIYQFALDRTIIAKSLTMSYSRPITKKLQANLDFTLADTGGSPASGTAFAQPATGSEYFYGAQLIGSGMIFPNDIYILSARYADTQNARTYTADINARVPVTNKFRLSPRARYSYRTNKLDMGYSRQFQPTLRMNYYPIRHSEIEVELGANLYSQRTLTAGPNPQNSRSRETGFVANIGYRLDF